MNNETTHFLQKMKKNILIITILIGYQSIALAQKKVLYGVYAGANVSKLKPLVWSKNNKPFSKPYKWTPSYNFGAFVIYNLGKSFYVESGTTIISKKSIGSPEEFDRYYRGYFDGTKFYNLTKVFYAHYNNHSVLLQIPLSLHAVVFQKNDFKTNIYASLLWEYVLSSKTFTSNSEAWEPIVPPQNILDEVISPRINNFVYASEDSNPKYNIGTVFGVGSSYKKFGIDLGINTSTRLFTSVQYRSPSLTLNLRYQIN